MSEWIIRQVDVARGLGRLVSDLKYGAAELFGKVQIGIAVCIALILQPLFMEE